MDIAEIFGWCMNTGWVRIGEYDHGEERNRFILITSSLSA